MQSNTNHTSTNFLATALILALYALLFSSCSTDEIDDQGSEEPSSTNSMDFIQEPEDNETPVFESNTYEFSLAENTRHVGVVQLLDAPDDLTYQLSESSETFEIDPQAGTLSVSEDVVVDYESEPNVFTIEVRALDGNSEELQSVPVVITITDENDNAPAFASLSLAFDLAENSSLGSAVGDALSATDLDTIGTISFSLASQAPTGPVLFEIDSQTGQISLSSSGAVPDFESGTTNYTLAIGLSDGENTGTDAMVAINITDENEVAPVLSSESLVRELAENSSLGSAVGDPLQVSNPGDSTSYSLVSQAPTGPVIFELDSQTGQLSVGAAGAVPDFEAGPTNYTLTIITSDGANASPETDVAINLTDENDNAPAFASLSLAFDLAENSSLGSAVGDALSATDLDTIGTISFSLASQAPTGPVLFEIDSQTGQISLSSSGAVPDFDVGPTNYTLLVGVSDGANAGTDATVEISITDENDVAPVLSSESLVRELAENSSLGSVVGDALSATDPDTIGTIGFSLVSQAPTGPVVFEIDSQTGQVSLSSIGAVPDFESSVNSYTLTIGLSDGENTGIDSEVVVTITDAEDGPVFAQSVFDYPVHDGVADNATFGPFEAQNNEGNPTTYSITGGADASLFSVSEDATLSQGTNALSAGSIYTVLLTASASGVEVDATINIHVVAASGITITGSITNTIGELFVGDVTTIGIEFGAGPANFEYTLSSSAPSEATNVFAINPSTGTLEKTAALPASLRPSVYPQFLLSISGVHALNDQFSHSVQVTMLMGGEVLHTGMASEYHDGIQNSDGDNLSTEIVFGVGFPWMVSGNRYIVKHGIHNYIRGVAFGDFTAEDAANGETPNFFRLSLDQPTTNINLNGTNYRFDAAHIYFNVTGNLIQGRLLEAVGTYPASNWLRFNAAGEVVDHSDSKIYNWNGVDYTGIPGAQ